MRKTHSLFISLFLSAAVCLSACGVSYAVMPPSTSLEEEPATPTAEQHLEKVIEKLKQRNEEDTRFLEDIESELRDLKA